jgi:endonuclease-3 related protein
VRKNLVLNALYVLMETRYGPTHWWPGDTPFEIAVGAILTQNTAWTNVERAIANLKRARLMSAKAILACPIEQLETALMPSGYFRVKARRVRSFCAYLQERYGGSMKRLSKEPLPALREELLAVNGIGPETADDILLYACGKPVFVVDAYTRRILGRHGLIDRSMGYEKLREFFEENLERDVHLYSEYHALRVYVGKDYCRRVPRCAECPLGPALKKGQPLAP